MIDPFFRCLLPEPEPHPVQRHSSVQPGMAAAVTGLRGVLQHCADPEQGQGLSQRLHASWLFCHQPRIAQPWSGAGSQYSATCDVPALLLHTQEMHTGALASGSKHLNRGMTFCQPCCLLPCPVLLAVHPPWHAAKCSQGQHLPGQLLACQSTSWAAQQPPLHQVCGTREAASARGAFALYLEPWHADVYDFIDLRKNHGKEEVSRLSAALLQAPPAVLMCTGRENMAKGGCCMGGLRACALDLHMGRAHLRVGLPHDQPTAEPLDPPVLQGALQHAA